MKKVARRVKVLRSTFNDDRVVVYHGDCLKVMASMPEASVDSIITDPPYHLTPGRTSCFPGRYGQYEGEKGATKGFMGREWDGGGIAFDPETWRAALRVAKPGAALLAFGGTRTFHRLACAVEDAGWEIRDCLMWVYGSGFPKSLDVSKAIDADACRAELTERLGRAPTKEEFKTAWKTFRKVVEVNPNHRTLKATHTMCGEPHSGDGAITTPTTPDAARWQGWGTGLKPSWEPIILARKPLDGTVAECALRHGTGALNVDGCRIAGPVPSVPQPKFSRDMRAGFGASDGRIGKMSSALGGRWPPNVVLQHDARCVLVGERKVKTAVTVRRNVGKGGSKFFGIPKDMSDMKDMTYGDEHGCETVDLYACVPGCPVRMLDGQSGARTSGSRKAGVRKGSENYSGPWSGDGGPAITGSSGGASRFFYTPKASTTERILGCPPGYENRHPTVKPLDLCRWLCRLTNSPDGDVVLDPFSGSGSIAVAALLEGRQAIAIELEEESANATVARVQAALKYGDKLQGLKRYRMKGRKKMKRRQ